MKKWKLILLTFTAIFLIIQFIRPSYDSGELKNENDIYHVVNVSDDVHAILVKACYDCHSDHTEYPWYSHIQPFGWWIADHVEEGKEELNFSQFKKLPQKAKLHKLHECIELIEENKMPLNSYLWIHSEAKLTKEEKEKVIQWAEKSQHEILEGGK